MAYLSCKRKDEEIVKKGELRTLLSLEHDIDGF